MKILQLFPTIEDDIPNVILSRYSDVASADSIYKEIGVLGRAVRRALSTINLSTGAFLASWVKSLNTFDIVIIEADINNITVPRVLRNLGYSGRIIYWYWNPVISCVNPNRINRDLCEVWSFDKGDCERFGMEYNSQFYFSRIPRNSQKPIYDAYFIGLDKGRYTLLDRLKNELSGQGISCRFDIVKDGHSIENGTYTDRQSYSEIISTIERTRALVDIVQEGQRGMTLRSMESLFFNKCLITNNLFVAEEPFYSPERVFLLGKDDMQLLPSFIMSSPAPISQELLCYYDYENWMKRFNIPSINS